MTASVFAERYLYLPSVGFSWLCAGALLWVWRRIEWRAGLIRWGAVSASILVALLAARATAARTLDWRSDRTLIVSTLAVLPTSPHMRVEYGMLKWAEGNHAAAEHEWQLALTYKPDSVEALADLGFAKLEEKQYAEAIPYLEKAIELSPRFAAPHVYLARVFAAQGKPEAAESEFRQALAIHPTNTDALKALGQFYLAQGRPDEAALAFRASVEIYSDSSAWSELGKIYDRQNDSEEAEKAWRHVLELEPFDPDAHRSLGQIYLARRQWRSAAGEFEACLLMDPADPVALAGLRKIRDLSGSPVPSNPKD
jgi:Flp pilus assembly protein TadD